MTLGKNNKMMSHLNHRMRVIFQDTRVFVGYFKAFDKHMNIILVDCEEIRKIKAKSGQKGSDREEKRVLGLILLRGEHIVSMSVDGPPAREDDPLKFLRAANSAGGRGGPGMANPTQRPVGMQGGPAPMGSTVMAPPMPGLQGPMRGMGGPAPNMMNPSFIPPPINQMPPGQMNMGQMPPGPPPPNY
uniref:Sm domain-containing protein n=1 Tax=Rhabditophanes sp. KR3021 TaxID=114890 RepID=A0AC35U424_9BILA